MIRVLAAPSAGQPIRASFFAELLREVRANRPLASKNVHTTRTPNGTHISAVGGAAEKHSPAAKIPGRFEITLTPDEPPEEGSEEEQTYTATFKNPYYDIGGKSYEVPIDKDVNPTDVQLSGIKDGDIIILKVSAGESLSAELATSNSFSELQASQQSDVEHYSTPLYKISNGSVACDFRVGPIFSMGEF